MSPSTLHVLIRGRVQGVGFRFAARMEAERLGIEGWVRNLPDGRVEASYSGSREALEHMLAWCRTGPPLARVDEVVPVWTDTA